jgi:hypothetical protein
VTSRRLTGLLIASIAVFSVAIPSITSAAAIQRDRKLIDPDPVATCPVPTTPATTERRPKTVRDRWRSPHRNLSTTG